MVNSKQTQSLSNLLNAKASMHPMRRVNKQRIIRIAALSLVTALSFTPTLAFADETESFWTDFVPSTDTRLIFVSSSTGNDSNSGLNPDAPVKSLAKGYELLRDGSPDWMLLKRGDTWNSALPNWDKSGRSEFEIMILGAYGDDTARPQIRPDGGASGMNNTGTNLVEHVAFVGFHLEPLNRADDERPTGFRWLQHSNNIHFEDLYVSGFRNNLVFQEYPEGNSVSNITVNGCVVVDSWSTTTHSQGLYASGVDGLIIENSVFDHNGFNESRGAEPTIFNHNLYVQNSSKNVAIRQNIISNASSHGVQLRPGGVINDNLFIRNALAVLLGGGTSPNTGGVEGSIQRNLIMYGKGIDSNTPRSFGITASNINHALIKENFFYMSEIGYNGDAVSLAGDRDLMLKNVAIEHNSVINWHGSISIAAPIPGQSFENIAIRNNYIYRDLTVNNENRLFDKAFLHTYSGHESAVSFTNNSYTYYGMHGRPFRVGDTDVSTDNWIQDYEPSGKIQSSNNPPSGFELEIYMSSINLQGGKNEFIAHARNQSRQTLNLHITSMSVYHWFADIIPE